MNNGITYVTPDPCPHCGGRVSTGIAGDEDSEKYMYVCGQCDTWFEQKGYPTTSKRYVTEETEVNALRARVAELQSQRDQSLSMLGAIISSAGGIYHIPDHMLQVGYEFKSERGDNETIVCARKV